MTPPPGPDRLLDRPARAPQWVPSVDNERGLTWLWRGLTVVLAAGVLAFVVAGADRPADPVLGAGDPAAGGCAANPESRTPLEGFGEAEITIVDEAGESRIWCVLLADDDEQRQRGLMEVTDLGGYEGMLFTYEEDREGGFWMSNTPMPLTVAYVGADGFPVGIVDMEPCEDSTDCPGYPSPRPFRYALEVPQGEMDDLGLTLGGRLLVGTTTPAG